ADYTRAQPRQRFFCAYCIATSYSRQNYGGAYGADFGRAGIVCTVLEIQRLATVCRDTLNGMTK
ncbi:hypothetical protein HUC27_23910, partial [Escherichia coli]|nr:hypothetical protein [Escherichia coli]